MTDPHPQGAARDYLATPPDAPSDARDWLKAQLSRGVDDAPAHVREFLDALHWRQRAVCYLLFAEHLTQERVGWVLGITRYTVMNDVSDVCVLLRGIDK